MRTIKWFVAVPLVAMALVAGGTWAYIWAYIQFVHGDAPERLTVGTAGDEKGTSAEPGPTARGGATAEGRWRTTQGTQVGYRVKEVLFGQAAEAVGRTGDVTGEVDVTGTVVSAASFTVDMATVRSDESRRDNQFRGRIMDVATHPTAMFKLTEPVEVGSIPSVGAEVRVRATGDLTLRGTTRRVSFDLVVKRAGDTVQVAGTIPVVFAEWGIPDPSFGPARTEDRGELEFLVVLAPV